MHKKGYLILSLILIITLFVVFSNISLNSAQNNSSNNAGLNNGNNTYQNCTIKNSTCCLGDVCNYAFPTCVNGTVAEFKGCDDNCMVKFECKNQIRNETQEQKRERLREAVMEKNRIKFENRTGQECPSNCTCTGSVVKCMLGNATREMTVYAGKSGNIIVQVKGVNMSTNVTLYHHNNKTYGNFSNESVEIFLPDQIQEKIRDRIRQRTCECENIELRGDGVYQVQTKKKARLFWIFPVRERVEVELNAENGEILRFRNPWWGFLANDIVED